MACLKTYGFIGKIEYSALYRLGSARFRVNFEGGSVTNDGIQPAKFKTSNGAMQMVIEASDDFKNGKVKIIRKDEIEEEQALVVAPQQAETEKTQIPTVTTAQMAREYLKAQYGASTAELQNATAIKEYAEKVNVEFPNWQ